MCVCLRERKRERVFFFENVYVCMCVCVCQSCPTINWPLDNHKVFKTLFCEGVPTP